MISGAILPATESSLSLLSQQVSPLQAGGGCESLMSNSREQQFEVTLREFHSMIARVVASYERIPALQEELYQEISVALWRALPKFEENASIKTYVLAIAHKRAISHVARHARQPEVGLEPEQEQLLEDPDNRCPSKELEQERQKQALQQAINQLRLADRQLVTLALEGVSYKDISEILGLSVTNVGARLNRAKERLLNAIQNGGVSIGEDNE